jgi:ribonuclease G
MGTVFLVNSDPEEVRIAELRNGKLFDFDIERGQQGFGSIYTGKVVNVIAGMEAAFVDIGEEKNGLLHFRDAMAAPQNQPGINKPIKIGDLLMVQVARPAFGNKGPRLTTRLSMPGRFFVLVAPWDTVGVSRRIESDSERSRLKAIAEKLRPLDLGLIVRTEAEGVSEEELGRDVIELSRQYQSIRQVFFERTKDGAPQKQIGLLHQDLGLLGRIMRDRFNANVEAIILDSKTHFHACQLLARQLLPSAADKVTYYSQARPIFEHYGVEKALNRALSRTVPLAHGGSLVIEETEALTTVDVNTGKFVGKSRLSETILQTNLEAVEEATLQLRLRGIGGVIVIDFIDMEKNRDRIRILDALESALKHDRAKTHIVQISPSGLVEITRRREGLSLRHLLNTPCQTCKGEGLIKSPHSVAIDVRRKLRSLLVQHENVPFQVKVHPSVAVVLMGPNGSIFSAIESEYNSKIVLKVDEAAHIEAVQIEPARADSLEDVPVSIRATVGIHDPLYPADLPEFAVWNDILVKLPPVVGLSEHQPRLKEVVVLEILTISRWFATARLLRQEQ